MYRKVSSVVCNLVLVFALFVLSGYFSTSVVLAHSASQDAFPFVKDAQPAGLKRLLAVLQPRIKKELGTASESLKTSMPANSLPVIRTISLERLFFDNEKRLVIDLGKNAKTLGTTDFRALADYIVSIVADELHKQGYSSNYMSYYFEIAGVGFENVFRPILIKPSSQQKVEPQDVLPSQETPAILDPQTNISVNGHTVALNPGHGYYYNGISWVHYGASYGGVQEDNLNADMAVKLNQALKDAGIAVIPLRELDHTLNSNSSQDNKVIKWWEMGAGEYAKTRLGQPFWVWNTASSGNADDRDINARPFLANALNAETMISVHNNAHRRILLEQGAEWCGTLILFDNGNSRTSQSQNLADKIKNQFNGLWSCGVEVQGRNTEGENTYFYGPAVIVEVGNMPNDDVRPRLLDPAFQQDAMNRIKNGIVDYYGSLPVSCPSATASTWRVQYWTSPSFLGIPYNKPFDGNAVVCQNENTISHDWGKGGPSGVTTDRFSLRATTTQYLSPGRYRFHLSGDDGVRLLIDGLTRIEQWKNQSYCGVRKSRMS